MKPPALGENPDFDRMVDASMKALNAPGGEEILDAMIDKKVGTGDGIIMLLLLSGDYSLRDP